MRRTALAALLCLCAGAAGAAEESKPDAVSGLSQSKFLGLLYSEIAKRTPTTSEAGPGSATANFHIAASGRVDNVTIVASTSPAHAEIARKILDGLQGPPPPGGSFDVSQKFNFH
jgi:hypothetical protein